MIVDVYDYGIKGLAIASSFSNLLNIIVFSIYTTYFIDEKLRKEAWFSPFRRDSFRECFDLNGLKSYMKFGLTSIGMLGLEWWSYEMMMVFSAYIGV